MFVTPLLAAAFAFQISGEDLVQRAIAAAKTSTSIELMRPHVLHPSVVVETPFLRVALQARDAMDRYLPFSEADVSAVAPVVTITAHGQKVNFKHLVIAVPGPGATDPVPEPPLPEPSPSPTPALTYEEAVRREKAARKRGGSNVDIEAVVAAKQARAKWVQEMERRERAAEERESAARAAMTILQPTTIESTEHVWQNAFNATFKTVGVKATFPLDALEVGREIRAVFTDGTDLTIPLTPRIMARLR